jgi:hypothetical protein
MHGHTGRHAGRDTRGPDRDIVAWTVDGARASVPVKLLNGSAEELDWMQYSPQAKPAVSRSP